MRRSGRLLLLAAVLGLAAWLAALNSCSGPLVVPPLAGAARPAVIDSHHELARRHAPWIVNKVHPTRGRQDLPVAMDFDGDLDGDNNWENLPRFRLPPALSYACLETATHWFLTYHVFHPRDWTLFDLGLHLTHEGDGENLQVVVDKRSGLPVLLFTQAHYRGGVSTRAGSGFAAKDQAIRGPLLLVDDSGEENAAGTHPVVFIESCGHGIYGAAEHEDQFVLAAKEPLRARGHALILRPARPGEAVVEPALDATEPVPYALDSITAQLWPLLRDGKLTGAGRLLDGTVRYEDARVRVDVPRYHEGNRFSGPFGADRGISPFAVDFGFDQGTLGALFFDPARRYRDVLVVPEPWSLDYIDYPFGNR